MAAMPSLLTLTSTGLGQHAIPHCARVEEGLATTLLGMQAAHLLRNQAGAIQPALGL